MEEDRPVYAKRILISLVIATVIFSIGFLLSYSITYFKYQEVSISQEKIRYELMGIDIQKKLMTLSCDSFDFSSVSSEMDSMGSIIGILEERFGKNDAKVLEQKKIYSMLEVQHFLLIKDYNENCKKSISTILFFYSNEEEFSASSEKIGYMLDTIKKQNKEVMIYSFDYDLDIPLINSLKKIYNVTQRNTIVIDEKTKITDAKKIQDIEKYLK